VALTAEGALGGLKTTLLENSTPIANLATSAGGLLLPEIPGYPGYLAAEFGEVWSEKRGCFLPQYNCKGYRRNGLNTRSRRSSTIQPSNLQPWIL